ncbi:cytochrome P450 [Actinomycetospora corticicola]|uniref:Cytochrome P450 n=1 Tax=Actinomycetospora corticicola TaxID=663602 RepID=A0A7Y9E231_9PSEU|nr:cytochrome P450 [Actinomycetospora corticicola]NYD39829.1 cytochrome P450 [Actinomycetospora corticicola]
MSSPTVPPGHREVAQLDLESVDLTDLGYFEDGPPHELFARMRTEAPVRWNPSADGVGFWSLTRAEDIIAVSRDPETFSSETGGVWARPDTIAPLEFTRNLLMFKDAPEHTKYRKIIQRAFLPRTVTRLEDEIRDIVRGRLATLAGKTESDLVAEIAVPVPLTVISRLLGSPDDDIDRLMQWTEQLGSGVTHNEDRTQVLGEMGQYFAELVARQRGGDRETLADALFNAEVDGKTLNEIEIALFFGILVFAGNDTTRSTFAGGMQALIENPDQLDLLRREPQRIPNAIEEILRWASPLNFFARTATRDTTIGGVDIAAGERIIMWYTAGNRDSAMIPNAEVFDITRDKPTHIAFGGGGPHFCLGAHLARRELTVLLEEVPPRLHDLAINGPVTHLRSHWANSLTSLPVSHRPVSG